jgi:putative endonuclease
VTRSEVGRHAEAAAVDYLVTQGYALVGTNVRVGALEIDVIARKDDLLVIAEVRSRGAGAYASALASVDTRKRARLVEAARTLWRDRFASDPTLERLRFDVIAVKLEGGVRVEHVAGAFTG